MIQTVLALGLMATVALGGCSSDKAATAYDVSKPLDKMSNEEWCDYYNRFLSNPQLSAKDRETDMQRMRSRGCAVRSS